MSVVKVYYKIVTSPWALTLTEPVPEAFKLPASDWPEKKFSGQSAKRSSRGRSTVKIHRRAFVSCSCVKGCNFAGFINISSETFLEKLSPLNELRNYGDRWGKLRRVRKHSHPAAPLRCSSSSYKHQTCRYDECKEKINLDHSNGNEPFSWNSMLLLAIALKISIYYTITEFTGDTC